MASLRDIRKRIASVKNTRKITKAMKLVAAAKLRRATDAAVSARPYSKRLGELTEQLTSQVEELSHPLLESTDSGATRLIVVSSDKGLCGSYNSNLFKAVDTFLAERTEPVEVVVIGKKARAYAKRRQLNVVDSHIDVAPARHQELAASLGTGAIEAFGAKRIGRCFVAYVEFKSALRQTPLVEQVVPVKLNPASGAAENAGNSIYEPSQADLLITLLPYLVENRLHRAMLEAVASEQASRMMAMDNATRNASELIGKLTLEYNQARQAAITTELVEIVSGAEAL